MCIRDRHSGSVFEQGTFYDRIFGQYRFFAWGMLFCNTIVPLFLFSKKIRTNLLSLFVISIFVNIGMWLERFVIIVSSLSHDFDPANWPVGLYQPTWVEGAITLGSFCMFFMLFLLFIKIMMLQSHQNLIVMVVMLGILAYLVI